VRAEREACAFRHETLFYSGAGEFVEGCAPFLREGLEREEPMLVAVAPGRIAELTEALGDDAAGVRFVDMRELGVNPARIIPAWQRFLSEHPQADGVVRGIGEPVWPGRTPAELAECERHEALLNVAFGDGRPWRLLCPYDVDGLEEPVLEGAWRNHPYVFDGEGWQANNHYAATGGPFDGELPEALAASPAAPFAGEQLVRLRSELRDWAEAELGPERATDLVMAVNELATNSVRHGGGEGSVRMWRDDDALVCEVSDTGHIEDPLAGRVHPPVEQASGRGLWLANHLCDLVQIRSRRGETVVRVHMRLAGA
jgi:anti-sigma regulatory factor (Ser/Thr protein kinase)